MQQRKHLSASGLYKIIKDSFEIGKGFEYRKKQKGISIVDSMLSGFAIFSLKPKNRYRKNLTRELSRKHKKRGFLSYG